MRVASPGVPRRGGLVRPDLYERHESGLYLPTRDRGSRCKPRVRRPEFPGYRYNPLTGLYCAFGDTVQSIGNSASDITSPYEVTLTFGATATAGNLLYAVFGAAPSQSAYVDPSGWTAGPSIPVSTGQINGKAYWKISDGTETSVLFSVTGSGATTMGGVFGEFEGPFEASPLDQTTENEDNIGTDVASQTSGTTGTTAQADELLLAGFVFQRMSNWDGGRALTNSFTEVVAGQDANNRAGALLTKRVVSATDAYETTVTTTDAGADAYGLMQTFKKQNAGGGSSILRQMMQHHH